MDAAMQVTDTASLKANQRVGGRGALRRSQGVTPGGASSSADLGGSSD